ncbi:multiubiquitin domain-containing protein [Bradyrhizobium genosp. A]|uniref:multiubiquitin domain-containing protein n=1 Tax=Bradyrhizobium genosp. A TaxID=83626 RepID=UPI003CF119F7
MDGHHTTTVRIHIDRQEYPSPNPTTGVALHDLANIPKHRDLFREVDGEQEDELILRDSSVVTLKEDEHFHSQKAITIIINGQKKEVTETKVTFDEIVKLGFPALPTGDNVMFTVRYRHGPRQNPSGTLLEGETVRIKNGMIFDVTQTVRS